MISWMNIRLWVIRWTNRSDEGLSTNASTLFRLSSLELFKTGVQVALKDATRNCFKIEWMSKRWSRDETFLVTFWSVLQSGINLDVRNMRTFERQGNYIKSLFPINFRRVKVVCITRCFFVLSCFVFFLHIFNCLIAWFLLAQSQS